MTRTRVIAALWLVFAFAAWTVAFDREVMLAAQEFTREQILRAQRGEAVATLHEAFSPRVRDAALTALGWAAPVVVAGAAAVIYTARRTR